ncbi:hypothetical protein HU200_062324 [Digitaria exilis]|uniref:Uncharacterized protein n=1 Tax=Digitaria exilis TaxID=1010633 RepID=A0A835E0P0_9POAL|nr:hypothetical protein HU200_062324 [Digitaria exilis]
MGALRRVVAHIPSAGPLSKPSRGAAPATCGAAARGSSSTGRVVGANQKLAAPPISKYTKVIYNGVVTEMEVIPVGAVAGGKVPPNSSRPMLKRPRVVEPATCGTMAAEKKPARRAGDDERLSVPNPKRTKVTRDGGVEASVVPAMGTLRKRMAAELDALHALVRKAELLSSGKSARFMVVARQKSEAPVDSSIKTSPVKRRKVYASAPAKIAELESREDKNKFNDICGDVSSVPILKSSAIVSVEEAVDTGDSEIRAPLKDDVVSIDICDGVAPVSGEKPGASSSSPSSSSNPGSSSSTSSGSDSDSDSGSSSSSGSDSDSDSGSSSSSGSDSDSDSDEDNTPVPEAVLPEENGTSVQAAPQPALAVVQSVEPEKLSKAALIAKAKIRKQLLEMERAVLPDEIIHPWELKDLCIAEYGRPSIMRLLGLFLKADA